MDVFVTGGSGLTGPAVVTELIQAGHNVTGLARSEESAARLRDLGASTHAGSLDDLDSLRAGAAAADDAAAAWFRIPGERTCLSFAERGLRPGAVRLAPTVHGPGDYGFIPMMIAAARRTGVAGYVSDCVRWPAVHRLDAATLFRLALERGPAGSAYHGAAENVELEAVAEIIGETLDLPVRSLTAEQAAEHFGNPFMALVYSTDAPASSQWTRETLGWKPTHPTLQDELRDGDYFTESNRSLPHA